MLRRTCLRSFQTFRLISHGRYSLKRRHLLDQPKALQQQFLIAAQKYSDSTRPQEPLTPAAYEAVCEETLESLCSSLEELLEVDSARPGVDVELSSGVLTVKLGEAGTYVINKQSPNKQIWLSSPVSGPKRYDFVDDGWVYRHDQQRLHELLSLELSRLLGTSVDLTSCAHAGR